MKEFASYLFCTVPGPLFPCSLSRPSHYDELTAAWAHSLIISIHFSIRVADHGTIAV